MRSSIVRRRARTSALLAVVLGFAKLARADLGISNTDHNVYWAGETPLPFEVTVFNFDFFSPVPEVVLTYYVPVNTSHDPAGSTPGWTCTGSGDDTVCTLPLGDLAAGEERTVTFAVRVNPGTDPKWDVYADARVRAAVAAQGAVARETPFDLTDDDCTNGDQVHECLFPTETNTSLTGIECCSILSYCVIAGPFGCSETCLSLEYTPFSTLPPVAVPRGSGSLDLFLYYRLRDEFFRNLDGGRKGIALYYQHMGEITRAIVADATLRDLGWQALLAWQPSLQALDEGQPATVSTQQVAALNAFLDALRPQAGKLLAGAIDRGRARLQVETWAGITIEEALTRLDRFICTRAATGPSVLCRIDDIGEVLETEAPAGELTDKVASSLALARSSAATADPLPPGRQRRAGFKKTSKQLAKIAKRVKSKKGKKAYTDAALRAKITDPIDGLRADLKQLAR